VTGTSKRDTQGRKTCEDIRCAKKKARRHAAKLTLNITFIVYFMYFQKIVVVIDCTNVNYNAQPYMEDDLNSLDRRSNCCDAV
jgi:hypothetical protein